MKQASSKIRNLDELQEADASSAPRPSRLGALAVASLGGACLVLATIGFLRKPRATESGNVDPLGALVEQSNKNAPKESLEATFPEPVGAGDSQQTARAASRARSARSSRPAGPAASSSR